MGTNNKGGIDLEESYIIDFERVNKLTTTIHDDQDGGFGGKFAYSTSRKKRHSLRTDEELISEVIKTLIYNKIFSEADIRDNKINEVLSKEDHQE